MQRRTGRGFDAFISYKRETERDIAAALSQAVRRIGVPFYRRSPLRIFRDDEILQAGTSLPRFLEEAIEASRFLIVLCSPAAATSPWVDREVRHFLASAPDAAARILPVIAAGHWRWDAAANDFDRAGDAIPPALAGVFAEEPFVIDIRFVRQSSDASLGKPEFRVAVAALAAPIRGVTREALDGAEQRQARQLRVAMAAAAVLAIGVAVGGVQLARELERQRVSARSRQLADLSADALQQGAYPRAFALARRAWELERSAASGEALLAFWARSRIARLDAPGSGVGAFSHAGERVVTSPSSMIWPVPAGVQVWDIRGQAVGTPLPPGYEFVAFTKDDSRLVVRWSLESRAAETVLAAGYDRQAYRSRLELREVGGRKLADVVVSGRWPTRAAADAREYADVPWESEAIGTSRSGDTIAIVTPEGHGVVWTRDGDVLVERLRRPSTVQVDVAAAGDRVLLTGTDGALVLWETSGRPARAIETPDPVLQSRFLPGERALLAISKSTARVVALDGAVLASFAVPGPVQFVESSRDGSRLLLERADGTFELHDTATWRRLMPGSPPSSELLDAQRACRRGGGEQGRVAGRPVRTVLRVTPRPVLSADGSRVLRLCGGSIEAWSLHSEVPVRLGLGNAPGFAALSPDGTVLLRFEPGEVPRPELQFVQPLLPISVGHSRLVNAVVPGLQQDSFVTTSQDATARIWSTQGDLVATLPHDGAVTSATVSRDRRRVLTTSDDGKARLWSADGGLERTFALGEPLVAGLLPPDADLVVAVGRTSVRGWSVGGVPRFAWREDAAINAATSNAQGEFVMAFTSGDAKVRSANGAVRCLLQHPASVLASAFSPDGRRVLTIAGDNQVRVFDLCQDTPVARFEHASMVLGAAWLDDSTIVTGARHGPVRLWRLGLEGPLRTLPVRRVEGEATAPYASVKVAPDRQAFVTATAHGLVEVWSRDGGLRYDFTVSDLDEAVLADDGRVLVRSDRHVEVFGLPSPDDVVRWFAGRVSDVPD